MKNSYLGTETYTRLGVLPRQLAGAPAQDRELFLFDGACVADLRGQVANLAELAGRVSLSELGGLAALARQNLAGRRLRAAVIAASPEQAVTRFDGLLDSLGRGAAATIDPVAGVFLGTPGTPGAPRISYLFPGQGSGKPGESAIEQRFGVVRDLYRTVTMPQSDDHTATIVAQPRIAVGSAAGLRVLSLLGLDAAEATGHSLGELAALHWAGAMTESELVALATARGRVMGEASEGGGAMAGIGAGPDVVESLLDGEPVVIGGYNGPTQTVISGPAEAVERVRAAAGERGIRTARVAVSHAFHSPAVAPAAQGLDEYLSGQRFRPLSRRVFSTLTGDVLPASADLRESLVNQMLQPVRYSQAVSAMAPDTDLFIEVGPGRVLASLTAKIVPDVPVIPLNTDASSLSGVLNAVAAAYVLGAQVRHERLFADRFAAPAVAA